MAKPAAKSKSCEKIRIRRDRRRRRPARRAAAAGAAGARSGADAGRGRAGAQGLSADAVLDQRPGILGQGRRPAGMDVLDRAVDPDRHQCRLPVRHQCLESRDLRRHREARFRQRALPDRGVLPAGDRQRPARRRPGLHTDGHPAPLARLADQFGAVALAEQRPLLPAQSGQRRPQESGISHRRGSAGRHRCAGGFCRRRDLGVPVGDHLHRGALDHRRRADGDGGGFDGHHSRLPRHRRGALCRDRLRLDHDDRTQLRAGLRGQEPGRGRIPLHADARARERRKHRAARRRGGRTRRHRQEFHQGAAAMGAAGRPAHAHHAGVAGIEPDRAGGAAVAVRAEISRRQHDARTGDAGGLRLHHRAERVRLAGRQLSAAGRLERLRAPHRLADDVARRAGARRARRRHRPHPARRDRGRGHAQPAAIFR